MLEFFKNLFVEDFMPHGYCYKWDAQVLWLHVVSDLLTALAYYSIPVALIVFLRKRKDIGKMKLVFWLFVLFILFCGSTHLLDVYTIWNPSYRLAGLVKAITALVSVITAVVLWPIIPRALQIPSIQELERLNAQLKDEIKQKEASEKALLAYQNTLEATVQERTQDLENINEELRAQIQANESSQAQIGFQASLLNQVQNPIIAIDTDFKIIYWNSFAEKIFGWSSEEALGKKPRELYLRTLNEEDISPEFVETMYSNTKWESEFICQTKSGETVPIYFVSSPIHDSQQHITGFVTVAFDLSERKAIENELREAKEKAEESVRVKQDFLSTMSHEIRTPLNAIIGFTELLLLENPKPKQVSSLKTLKFAGGNLLALINDILDFNKIEAQKLTLEEIPFFIKLLIQRLEQLYKPQAKEKNIQLITWLDPQLPKKIKGDELRISQILTNLMGNAIKFTEDGQVKVSVRVIEESEEDFALRFEVSDTGIGIPKDKQTVIFEAFQQAASDTTRRFGGTGLGLAIAQKLVALHQSQIGLISEEGKGSTFSFVLHLKKADKENELNEDKNSIAVTKGSVKFPKKTILVVDDNGINQIITGRFLERWGFEVVFADNGKIALELLQNTEVSQKIALILMDIYMPEMDGYTASKAIRAIEVLSSIPIIALTASIIENSKPKVYEAGMNDYLTKPFRLEDLRRILEKYLLDNDSD